MLFLISTPMSLLGLIPGVLPFVILFQEPINLSLIGLGYLLTTQFPSYATLIWAALVF
ncbi:MAG TPA: hypothetical protein VEG44_04370 [Candidatus Acidoferrales bacterium]|nr:hypothetical protein [Candidatus Acidoferrales bacterium]